LIFGLLLAFGLVLFALSSDWPRQSPLDVIDFAVSIGAITGVLLYSLGVQAPLAGFWRWFRWFFLVIAVSQAAIRAIEVAHRGGYSNGGSVSFVASMGLIIGPIVYFQWIAMTRLAARASNG